MDKITQSLDNFTFSVNSLVVNKAKSNKDHANFTTGFKKHTGSIDDLAEAEGMGFSYAMCDYLGDGRRKKANVGHVYGIALDYDNKDHENAISQFELINHQYSEYFAYATETASSTPEHRKYRAFIIFDHGVSADVYESLVQTFIIPNFKGIDPAALEAGRGFYGNSKKEKWKWKNENARVLPQSYFDIAIAKLEERRAIEREKAESAKITRELPLYLSKEPTIDETFNLLRAAVLGYCVPRLSRGLNNYHEQLRIVFGVLNSGLPRHMAIALLEEWSPTNPKIGWDIERIANSNERATSTCNIGTVFYYAKLRGFKFPKMARPNWQNKVTNYVREAIPKIKQAIADSEPAQSFYSFLTGFARSIVAEAQELINDCGLDLDKPMYYYYNGGELPTKAELAGRMVIVSDEVYQEFYERLCRNPDIEIVLDKGVTGSGKSHVASQLRVEKCFEVPDYVEGEEIKSNFNKIILSMPGHRNPTVQGIEENFPDLPARNNGYELDYDKMTALGRPFRSKATNDTPPEFRTQSNCHWADPINKIYASGRDPEKVCGGCEFFKKCKTGTGDGYGFLHQYHEAMLWQYASISPQLISKNLFTKKTIGVFDEIDSGSYEWVKSINFTSNDYFKFWSDSNQKNVTQEITGDRIINNKLFLDGDKITGLVSVSLNGSVLSRSDSSQKGKDKVTYSANLKFKEITLNNISTLTADDKITVIFKDEIDPTLKDDYYDFFMGIENLLTCTNTPKFGLENHDILFGLDGFCSGLGDIPENVDDLIKRIDRIEILSRPDMGTLIKNQKADSITALGMSRIAQIWSGRINGAFRFSEGVLSIQFKNTRMIDGIKNAGTAILQSATVDPNWLCLQLGIERSDMVIFAKQSEIPTNLLITQVVNGFGVFNKRRDSETGAEKKAIIKEHILKTDGINPEQLGEIEYKDFADGENLTHFADGRGSNLFKDKKSVVSYGVPFPHIGSAAANYITVTGDRAFKYSKNHENKKFTDYYNHLTRTEVLQECGRLRANRRPDEQLHYWICGDGDMRWLSLLGYRFEQVECKDIDTRLCTKVEQIKIRYLSIGASLVKASKYALDKLKMSSFVEAMGVSQSAIAQWITKYMSEVSKVSQGKVFEGFKKILVSLVDKKDKLINNPDLTDFEKARLSEITDTAIPLLVSISRSKAPSEDIRRELVETIGVFTEAYGSDSMAMALSTLDKDDKDIIASNVLICFNVLGLGVDYEAESKELIL